MAENKSVRVSDIKIDPELQCRECIDAGHVEDIAELYSKRGKPKVKRPRVMEVLDRDGQLYAIDQHRIAAATQAGRVTLEVQKLVGTWQDARDLATSANVEHLGLKRNHDTKMAAVLMTLEDHPDWSDGRIAKHTGTSQSMVSTHRPKIAKAASVKPEERVGIDNVKRKVASKPSKNGAPAADPNDPERFETILNVMTKLATEFNAAINSDGGENLLKYLTYFKLINYPNKVAIDGESVEYRPRFKGFPGLRRVIKLAAKPGRARTEEQVKAEFARKDEGE